MPERATKAALQPAASAPETSHEVCGDQATVCDIDVECPRDREVGLWSGLEPFHYVGGGVIASGAA
jgi:hypothetical protein